MKRRDFLQALGFGGFALSTFNGASLAWAKAPATADGAAYRNLLVLVELKGGNDGLNTVVPYADPEYYNLRPKIGVKRDDVLQLDYRTGLHPALQPLMPLWANRELAVVSGVGYPEPNLSHFRSIEIWDTASASNQFLEQGWLARAFDLHPVPKSFAADGVIVGSSDLGPLTGGTRAVSLANTEQFLRQARLAGPSGSSKNRALDHILKVEGDITQAAGNLNADYAFKTEFPNGEFGNAVKTASQVIASQAGVAVVRITLNGFDTHHAQPGTQANLLKQFAEGMVAMRSALTELNRWNSTLVLTYAEFGRRPKENLSNGTDHGTANAHFVLGGRVKGGLYGQPPQLTRLDGNGNLPFAVDFRSLYATALEKWWNVASNDALGAKFQALDLLKV
jgi:uncharacterized protein (DUF1501 family)